MQDQKNTSEIEVGNQKMMSNKELSLWEAFIPVFLLMCLLAYNIFFSEGVLLGDYSNQYILLIGGVIAAIVGFFNNISMKMMAEEVLENWKSVITPIIILTLVGALAGNLVSERYHSCNGLLWFAGIKP